MSANDHLAARQPRYSASVAALSLDVFERCLVIGLSLCLLHRLWMAGMGLGLTLLAISEGLNVVFTLIRRPSRQFSLRPAAWLLAFGASAAPLCVIPTGLAPSPAQLYATAILATAGVLMQISAKLTLGRSFGMVPANRGLKLSGPYRLVRHPMYLGYMLAHVGFVLSNPTGWNIGFYVLAYVCQIPRLLAEEKLLAADDTYRQYQTRVPFHLIPGVF